MRRGRLLRRHLRVSFVAFGNQRLRDVSEIFYYTGHGDQLVNTDDDEQERLD